MKHRTLEFALAFVVGATVTGAAQAATLTFNGTAAHQGITQLLAADTYSEAGFIMQLQTGTVFFIDNDRFAGGSVFDDDFVELDISGSAVIFTMDGGGLFDASSLRVGGVAAPLNSELVFTGALNGGGIVVQTVGTTVGNHDLVDLVGFTNLLSLTIASPALNGQFPIFDDLTVQAVPLPAGLGLLAMGLGGLGFRVRHRGKAA